MLIVQEVAHHCESWVGLVSRDHVTSSIHQYEPQVSIGFSPSSYFSHHSPDFLFSPLPLVDSFPVQAVQVLENTSSIDHKVILSVVDQDFGISEGINNIWSVTPWYIVGECSVNEIIAGKVLNCGSEWCFVCLQEFGKWFILPVVVSEIEGADASEVDLGSGVIIGDEIKVSSGIFIFSIIHVGDGICLEPSQNISELGVNASHWP